jgi:hypothetical protein
MPRPFDLQFYVSADGPEIGDDLQLQVIALAEFVADPVKILKRCILLLDITKYVLVMPYGGDIATGRNNLRHEIRYFARLHLSRLALGHINPPLIEQEG